MTGLGRDRRSGRRRAAEHAVFSQASERPSARSQLPVPLVVLVLGVLLTAWVAGTVQAEARADAAYEFEQSAQQSSVALEHRLRRYLDRLRNIGNFVANAPDATPAQFEAFVRADETFVELPSFAALFFIHRVEAADLDRFVAERTAVDARFALSSPPEGTPGASSGSGADTRYVLSMFLDGNLGFELPTGGDATSVATVRELMRASERTGDAVATSLEDDPLVVAADQERVDLLARLAQIEFFVSVPVYEPGGRPGRDPIIGWTGAMITDFDDVLRDATSAQAQDVGVELTVELGTGGNREQLSTAVRDPGLAGVRDRAAFTSTRTFEVHGVLFQTDVWSAPDTSGAPPIVLLLVGAGLLASALAASALFLRRRGLERERLAVAELADRAQFEADVADSVTDALVVLDREGRVVSGNRAWRRFLHDIRGDAVSPRPAEVAGLGEAYTGLVAPDATDTAAGVAGALDAALQGGAGTEVDVRLSSPRGPRWYTVRVTPLRSRRGGAVAVHSDITEQKLAEDELEHQASRDTLTGLHNRVSLAAAMEASLRAARRDRSSIAVLFVDLDGFKAVNDTHGHAAGDELLRVVADRLTASVRPDDVVARLGGDEFVVFLPKVDQPQLPERTARRVVERVGSPVALDGAVVRVTASVGVSHLIPRPETTADELLAQADLAMYHAKQHGGAGYDLASSPHKFAERLHDR